MIQIHQVNRLLPQTQCRECGYEGCEPYAQALVNQQAPSNLCIPGGITVAQELAQLLNQPMEQPAKTYHPALAWIDEAVCIGCTACIRACPVDAIMGASKYMHTVLANECTGCGLCVAPCPVDCIYMKETEATILPQAGGQERFAAANYALNRYQNRKERKTREAQERLNHIAERENRLKQNQQSHTTTSKSAKDLIAQAMEKAQAQQKQRTVLNNRDSFIENQLKEAKEKARYRRAMRDMQYGTEEEKRLALQWLQAYKVAQEEKQNSSY